MNTQAIRAVQPPHAIDLLSHSPAQTQRLGQRLGECLQAGDLVVLNGPFGAGKTQFIKGIAQGLGSSDMVTSPSFVLVNEYRAGPHQHAIPIYHIDLYRLEDLREIDSIGLEELIAGDGVCLIEWASRAQAWFPEQRLEVSMSYLSETKRALRFIPYGQRYAELVHALNTVGEARRAEGSPFLP